jgi:hypothetical protein
MAEAKSGNSTATEDIILAIFALLLISNALQSIPRFAQEKMGIDIGAPYLVAGAGLTAETPIGSEVTAINGATYVDSPGATQEQGTFAPGATLELVAGPDTVLGGARWWKVKDARTGEEGWVPETALVRSDAVGLNGEGRVGAEVRTILDTSLRKAPGVVEGVAEVAKGAYGNLTGGPEEKQGGTWWLFSPKDGGVGGWVPESALVLSSDSAWHAGSLVRVKYDVDMFNRAGGGIALGVVREGGELRILRGPEQLGGEYWWFVETSDGTQGWVPERALEEGGLQGWFKGVMTVVLVIAVLFSLILVAGVVYATIRTNQIRAREAKRIREALPKVIQPRRNERWEQILDHVNSENPNDWRIAIIEADIILDELLVRLGYPGATLGERLKEAVRGEFKTLDSAWEAHRIRNAIAHAGSDFVLTQYEAKRAIMLYQSVFDEFKYS